MLGTSANDKQKLLVQQARARKNEEKQKIAEEWGFEKPESMAIWEARQRKKKATKKVNP